MYKTEFKYFKSKRPPPDMSRALDFRDPATASLSEISRLPLTLSHQDASLETSLGLRPIGEWQAFGLAERPGLVVIPDVLTAIGQRYWTRRCVADFTLQPARLNLDRHGHLEPGTTWWNECAVREALTLKLRWATLGYHHDWDTKVYTEQNRSAFPEDLAALSRYVVAATGGSMTAQAAIVNFYSRDSTLSGHSDRSEPNGDAPLFSLSLGQACVFLVGGQSADELPQALRLSSGDVVVMAGESRRCVHGVPRVICGVTPTWDEGLVGALPTGDHIRSNEVSTNGTRSVEVGSNEVGNNNTGRIEIGSNEDEKHEARSIEVRSNEVGNNDTGRNEEEKNEVRSSEVGNNDTGSNKVGENGVAKEGPAPAKRHKTDDSEQTAALNGASSDLRWAANSEAMADLVDETKWKRFGQYLAIARINMNVRQVLFDGQTQLPDA